MRLKRPILFLLLPLVWVLSLGGRPRHIAPLPTPPAFMAAPTPWADSVMASLTLEDRIAQLMMVAAYSNKGRTHVREVEDLVRQRNIGGLIFFQGGPVRQATLTEHYQRQARTPLLIGMDLEWGLAMRLDSTMRFPRQMTLGAIPDEAGIEAMGAEIARQMRRLGVHVSFSPVADVNNNPANPVINDRSFGEDREQVARKAVAYMRGLQNGGVIATAKHFPGHGDTDVDSHLGLPLIAHTRARLDSLELYPFERMVSEGLSAMMVGHLEVPALDTTPGLPSTLSRNVVSDLLEKELGFKGLIFTDALNMKGVANADQPGEIELRALLAGNDVLLFPQDPARAIDRIRQAVDSGLVPREMIDHKCLKVLRAKAWAGLGGRQRIATEGLVADLNTPAARALRRSLYRDALTVLRNDAALPIRPADTLRVASLVIGDTIGCTFQRALSRYGRVDRFRADKVLRSDSANALLRRLEGYDLVIASVHGTSYKVEKEFGVPQVTLDLLRRLGDRQRMAFVLFANPYRLVQAYGAQRWRAVVCAYEETEDTQDLVAQMLHGALPARGRLPVTASAFFPLGASTPVAPTGVLRYTLPEAAGVSTADLQGIDDVVSTGLREGAFPGCQVLVARNGQVLWNKAYGRQTSGGRPVKTDDLYDLASVTKVAGTTLAVMKLYDEGRLALDAPLARYLPEVAARYPAHGAIVLRDLLTHQAGLVAFVPYHRKLVRDGRLRADAFAATADAEHPVRVAEGCYMRSAFQDSLWAAMLEAPVGKRGEYLYSDLDFHLLARVVERVAGEPLDVYLERTFYRPLGLATMGYRPLERFPSVRIAPTEDDRGFRMRLLQGDVHDQGAAILGGVAGHAGLFSNAGDLAVLLQMVLDGGVYGGVRYFTDSTVATFTRCQFCLPGAPPAGNGNRRGLGWDKPQPPGKPGPACECVSYLSFGHTGFTGTQVWVDPVDRSIYVFLSNRVNPSAENKKLGELNIRTRIQEVVHEAFVRAVP
jgi:beta-glucosidase-like glycosyl hydrolase/CubicO group peptidase (beta-lactamase class C family)